VDRWAPVPPELDQAIAVDRDLAEAAREARRGLLASVSEHLAGMVPAETLERSAEALLMVPRERFVLPEDIAASAADSPRPLDWAGLATVSAPHMYAITYGILGLAEGDHLLELGTGTGYGAALASHIVGARGRVTSIEIDPDLHARAARILAEPDARGPARVSLLLGDARALAPEQMAGPEPLRVTFTFAIASPPEALIAQLPVGGRLIAPVGKGENDQILGLWERCFEGVLRHSAHGGVRYVSERG